MKFSQTFAFQLVFAISFLVCCFNGQYYCPNVRYVKINAGANCLQISQVAVYNSTGANVAKGKNVTASSVYVGDLCPYYTDGPVDGVLTSKYFGDCTQKAYASSIFSGAYWQVDLGSSQTVSKVVYYNRLEIPTRATTYSITLLNSNSVTVCTGNAFTAGLIQNITLIYTGVTNSPTKKPSFLPTVIPTRVPSSNPSVIPTKEPTTSPTRIPSFSPTVSPTKEPIIYPTSGPTSNPSQTIQTTAMCELSAALNLVSTTWACTNGFPTAPICSGSTTTWTGVTCSSEVVTAIKLSGGAFSGTLSSSIGYMTSLTVLWLYTSSLSGTLPTTLGYLSAITYLYFTSTLLTGTVPTEIGYLTKLAFLYLDSTSLTGSIPSQVCAFTSARAIDIRYSRFSCYASCLSSSSVFVPGTVLTCNSDPTTVPTWNPSKNPSNAPTSRPTDLPTITPTTLPTKIPTNNPTSSPSKSPTVLPTDNPTSSPSESPTVLPTDNPTSSPSESPTVLPTDNPTSSPSESPTTIPSIIPSSSPTVLPTTPPSNIPSSNPSAIPTTVPTAMPTATPTEAPTTTPSTRPSTTPTAPPTTKPSNSPTRTPTFRPSLQPATAAPTTTPVSAPTSTPTIRGATNPPSASPSSTPTWNLLDYKTKPIYRYEYLPLLNLTATTTTTTRDTKRVFSSFTYKGYVKEGGCSDWKLFGSTSLNLAVTSYYFSDVTATYGFENFHSVQNTSVTASCSSVTIVSGIVTAIQSKTITSTYPDYAASCSGYLWRVFTCNGAPVLCLNCSGDCSCPGPSSALTSSCDSSSSCRANSASYSHLVFGIKQRVLYPKLRILDIVVGRTDVEVVANISSAGRLYCLCIPVNTSLTSVYQLKQYGSSAVVLDYTKNTSLSISGLSPSTSYTVYCYTEDAAGHGMDLATVSSSSRRITTSCCPTIAFTSYYSNVVEYTANYTAADSSVFSFTLEKTPTATLTVKLRLDKLACSGGISTSSSTSSAAAFPSTFVFASGSLVLSGSFVVRGSPGCYEITASGAGLRNSTVSLSIYNTSTVVTPAIKSAYFSSDGSSLYIAFDSSTNYGKTKIANYASGFPCSELLLFRGSSSFTCKWLSNRLMYAYLSTKTSTTPSVGDAVQLLPGVISPSCSGKVCYAASSISSVAIGSPLNPLDPAAALSAPRIVSSCSDIILDPTASVGQGLKDWSTVQWYVSSNDFDASFIDSFLNTYHNSTMETVTLPNSYLTTGSITFTLYLTNFLGLSSFATASVEVSSSSDIPYTTISGSSTVSLYRWQTLSLFASATVSTCGQSSTNTTTSSALSYSWKVYQGLSYQSSLSSSSLNPRYFKLPAYSLDTLSQYTVQVTTTSVATGSFASAAVSVYVKQSGIIATISGGAKRVVSTFTPLVLNASTSYDEGTGSGAGLTYSWSCSIISPVYGDPCGLTLSSSTSVITLSANTLSAKTYNFTVIAAAATGSLGTASTTIIALHEVLPIILFDPIKKKYNPEDRILLAGNILATAAVQSSWSCPGCGVNLTTAATTPLVRTFFAGTASLQLALSADSFDSGMTYTMQLAASYATATAFAQVSLVMNSPPAQGRLRVWPSQGVNLATSFYLNTYGWVDDASDYPISYTFIYYSKDAASSSLIRSLGTVQYAYAYIGQGLSVRNYSVTCVATASDIYGCSDSTNSYIRVLPLASAASLQSSMAQQLTLASETSNPDLTTQTSAATASYLNAATCSAAPACAALNRSDCDSVVNTCGPCLSGYLGVSGYANTGCQLPSSLRVTGSACSASSDCVSHNCQSNVCSLSLKACANNCSGYGVCQYYDSNSNRVASCDANSAFCQAKCNCHTNRFGTDCSLTSSAYQLRLGMRSDICSMFYATVDIQDVSADVIVGRASLLSSLLLDVTQLTAFALSNCTLALTTTVRQYPSLCVGDYVYETVIAGLSSVLEFGSSVPQSLSVQVSTAIDTLLANRQLILATQEESSVISTNLRVYSTVSYNSDLATQSYTVPQSDLEAFTRVTPVVVQLASTASDASAMLRVSLSQSTINIRNATTDASIVKLQVFSDSTTATTTAKLLLQNSKKMQYYSTASYNSTVVCATASSSYNKSANCSQDPSLKVYCPGTTARTVTAVCPASQYLPQCLSWNGVEYYQDPSCQRVTYSPTNTSCECSGSTDYVSSRRQLSSSSSDIANEFSASASIQVQAFVSTWSSAADLSASSITDNYYIVMTVSLIMGFFIFGFVALVFKEKCAKKDEVQASGNPSEGLQSLTLENATAFFESILPEEFKSRPWYANFWIKLLECHPHLAFLAPARGRRLYHTKMWLCFCFEILFFIFMDSIFAPLAAADDTTCEVYLTQTACETPRSFDMVNKLCSWDVEQEICLLNILENTFTVTIMVVLVASLTSQPLAFLAEYLIDVASGLTEKEIEAKEREEKSSENDEKEAMVHNFATDLPEREPPRKSGNSSKERRLSSIKVAPLISSNNSNNMENGKQNSSNNNNSQVSSQGDRFAANARNTPDFMAKEVTEHPDKALKRTSPDAPISPSDNRHLSQSKVSPHSSLMRVSSYDSAAEAIGDNRANIPTNTTMKNNTQTFNVCSSTNENNHDATMTRPNHEDRDINGKSTLMTSPSLFLLGARLTILQQHLDASSPEEELEWLLKNAAKIYETDVIADAPKTISLLQAISGSRSVTADKRKLEMNKMHSKMLHKISMVRARTVQIVTDLDEMGTDNDKEKYLMKRFIVELKKGVYKKVILRHFFELVDEEEEEEAVGRVPRALATIVLILLAVGCLFYILLTGISLGQATTILWLEALAIGLVQDVFLLKPLGIWFRFIAIASIVSDSVRHVTDLVHDRVHLIMRRTRGVVRHNSLLVQHFNAACRAARVFPYLQTSRLLIALNDYDLPKSLPNKRRLLKLFLDMTFLLFVLAILVLTLMPELIQETLIEASMTSIINFPIYALILLSNLSIALPILVIVLLLLVFAVREYYIRRKRARQQRIQQQKRQEMALFVANKFQKKL